jgi:hypothetical protein
MILKHFCLVARNAFLVGDSGLYNAGRRFFMNVDLIGFSGKTPFCLGA